MALVSGRCSHLSVAMKALEVVAPLALAAKWDNVGLIVDATAHFELEQNNSAFRLFLTNDLTPSVLEEAIKSKSRLIVSYHPPVFSGMKKFVLGGGQASSVVLQCARHGIAVYSPHTALDCVNGGINDWLLDGIIRSLGQSTGKYAPIKETECAAYLGSGMGDGRIATMSAPSNVNSLIAAVKAALGLERVQVALPATSLSANRAGRDSFLEAAAALPVRSIAVCAGSGASVLTGAKADVYITGEMSHHEVLAANAAGVSVILTNHSNCERGYLPVFKQKLIEAWAQQAAAANIATPLEVIVSAVDADPLVSC